jgi:hypothetical protein
MDQQTNIVIYEQLYTNGKLHTRNIKSDFDIIRELNKLHKKTIDSYQYWNKTGILTLMCSNFHGQPYK